MCPALKSAAASPRDGPGGDGNRRPAAPQRGDRRVLHRNDVGGRDEAHAAAIDIAVPRELRFEDVDRSRQRDAQVEVPRGRQGAVNDVPGREVAAHCVNCDPDHRVQGSGFTVHGSRFPVPGSQVASKASTPGTRSRENLENPVTSRTTLP
jgi:hypothetical protein